MNDMSLGIIGGMGPKATSVFVDRIIERTEANSDQEHLDMVILNHASLPDRTRAIIEKKEALFLQAIDKDMKLLEAASVSHIAIPCNTSHYFYDQMQNMTTVPIIHMVDETIRQVRTRYPAHCNVGIVATDGTIHSEVYQKGCEHYGLTLIQPNKKLQREVMRLIYDKVKRNVPVDPIEFEQLVEQLLILYDCKCVIIACTELSCIPLSSAIAEYCIDAMDVLVNTCIHRCGKKILRPLEALSV